MVVMSFRVPADVRERFIAKAEEMGANPTEVIRDLVTDWAPPEDD
jgi:antitoxin component of RelBE/YafQ-DinJ toxin-antitoxin module